MGDSQEQIKLKKIFLKRYRRNNTCILRLKNKLYTTESRLKSPKSPSYSSMPKGNPVTTEDILADKCDLEKRIERLNKKGERIKNEILTQIDMIDDPRYCEILEAYFIDCLDMEDIAEEMGYGPRHVYKLYSKAIERLVEFDSKRPVNWH